MNLTVDQIHNIHFEITNKCNSRCPGCARTLNGDTHPYYNELLIKSWMKNAKFHNQECFKKCGDFAKRQSYKFSSV